MKSIYAAAALGAAMILGACNERPSLLEPTASSAISASPSGETSGRFEVERPLLPWKEQPGEVTQPRLPADGLDPVYPMPPVEEPVQPRLPVSSREVTQPRLPIGGLDPVYPMPPVEEPVQPRLPVGDPVLPKLPVEDGSTKQSR